MLLNSLILQRVIEQKLHKNARAEPSDLFRITAYHELLNLFNKIIQLSATKLPVHHGSQAMESVALHCESVIVSCDNLHKRLNLDLGEVLIDRVGLDELRRTLEERVYKVGVLGLSLVEKFENSAQESTEKLLEAWKT